MSASKKLLTSIKALTYLAEHAPVPKHSAEIAEAINCNASKLRGFLSILAQANIVCSTQGNRGGFSLAKAPAEIDLQTVYCAIEDQKAFQMCLDDKSNSSLDRVNTFFEDLFSTIQVDIENRMKLITLEQIIEEEEWTF
jgi:Rrf2 family protein